MLAAVAHACPVLPTALAFLEGIGAMEMMLVAVIGLLLFGGKGLPDMARTLGKVVREFKKATANVEEEVKRVMDEEPAPRRKPRPTLPNPAPAALPTAAVPTPAPAVETPPPAPPRAEPPAGDAPKP